MDATTGVPKKVVRHVQKAVETLKYLNKPIRLQGVLAEIKYTMRNLVPVADLHNVVKRYLKAMRQEEKVSSKGRKKSLSAVKRENASRPNVMNDNEANPYNPSYAQIFQTDASSQYSGKSCSNGSILRPDKYLRCPSKAPLKKVSGFTSRRNLPSLARPNSKHYNAFKPSPVSRFGKASDMKNFHVDSRGSLYPCTGFCKKSLKKSPLISSEACDGICIFCKHSLKLNQSRYRL